MDVQAVHCRTEGVPARGWNQEGQVRDVLTGSLGERALLGPVTYFGHGELPCLPHHSIDQGIGAEIRQAAVIALCPTLLEVCPSRSGCRSRGFGLGTAGLPRIGVDLDAPLQLAVQARKQTVELPGACRHHRGDAGVVQVDGRQPHRQHRPGPERRGDDGVVSASGSFQAEQVVELGLHAFLAVLIGRHVGDQRPEAFCTHHAYRGGRHAGRPGLRGGFVEDGGVPADGVNVCQRRRRLRPDHRSRSA